MVRILIVEDDPNLREGFAAELSRAGHCVETACDAAEAMAALGKGAPDILVLDLRLGHARGLEIARAAERQGGQTRLVLVAGTFDLTRSELFGLSPAVAAVLRKPVDLESLVAEVAALTPAAPPAMSDPEAMRPAG